MKYLVVFDLVFRRLLYVTCAVLLLVMLSAIGGQVVMRYLFNAPWHWSEELARYSMIWLAMLGGSLASRHAQHIALTGILPINEWAVRTLAIAITLISLAILALLFWQSWTISERVSRQTMAALRISMSWAYGALPVGFMLMIVGTLLNWLVGDPVQAVQTRVNNPAPQE